MREHHPGCGTNGTTYAYFHGSLLYRYHHDVAHTYGSGQQSTNAHKPTEESDTTEKTIQYAEQHLGVEHGDGLLVLGVNIVMASNGLTDVVGKQTYLYSVLGGKGYLVHHVAVVVHTLHHTDGDKYTFVGTSANSEIAGIDIHTYNTIVRGIDAYALSQGVATIGEEIVIHLLAYDAHLTVLYYIYSIDMASITHLWRTYLLIVLGYTIDIGTEIVLAIHGKLASTEKHGSNNIQFCYIVLHTKHIVHVHPPGPVLLKTLVCLGRRLCPYHGRVGGKVAEIAFKQFPQPMGTTNEADKHENAPEDAETREYATALVARYGIEYFP